MSTFSGTLGDGTSRTYANVTQYSAAGLKERESYGTGSNGMTTPLYLKLHYNKRQQLVDLRLGSVNDDWNWNRGLRQQLVDLRLGSVNDDWNWNRGLQTFYYGTHAVAGWNGCKTLRLYFGAAQNDYGSVNSDQPDNRNFSLL